MRIKLFLRRSIADGVVTMISETWPSNQWPSKAIHDALAQQIPVETERRIIINASLGPLKLATRPGAIMRDILQGIIRVSIPAGNG